MANSLTELMLETEKAEPAHAPSETRTIRLEGDILLKLEELANQENVSISCIINKALRRHVEWEIYAEKFGFMMAFTSKMRRIYESLTDAEARELGRQSAENEYSEFINFWFKKINFETTVQALGLPLCEYAPSSR